jgi:hypothetical protein
MDLKARLNVLAALDAKIASLGNDEWEDIIGRAKNQNGWFTEKSIRNAFAGIRALLEPTQLHAWAAGYKLKDQKKKIGIVMAGNIPMVGFHDLLATFVSGNIAFAKLSSSDNYLMEKLIQWMVDADKRVADYVVKADRLNDAEAVIATGSDNTARYFKYYFKHVPHIIRQNRTSVAVLDGTESVVELEALAKDAFAYFGLGCRNVSKIFVPADYDFKHMLDVWTNSEHGDLLESSKYINNYDYNKSIYLLNMNVHLDTGFAMIKQDENLVSPTSVVYYQCYNSAAELQLELADKRDKIQCVVSNLSWLDDSIPFGTTQLPTVTDYADGVDTLEFLSNL